MELINPWLNVTDICVLVIIAIGMLSGARRGFAGELIKLAIAVFAVVFGWRMSDTASDWLSRHIDWPKADLQVLSFFGLIVAVYLLLTLIRLGFRFFIDFSFKGKIELIGGALLGILRATTLCVFILLLMSLVDVLNHYDMINRSQSHQLVEKYVRPHYDAWAEAHPNFTLPEKEKLKERGFTVPEWEQYLGPLIAPDQED